MSGCSFLISALAYMENGEYILGHAYYLAFVFQEIKLVMCEVFD